VPVAARSSEPGPQLRGGSRFGSSPCLAFPGPTRYGGPCIGSAEYQPLAHYGIHNEYVAGEVPPRTQPLSVPFPAFGRRWVALML
jgi:hypothetical protein